MSKGAKAVPDRVKSIQTDQSVHKDANFQGIKDINEA